MRRFFNIPYYLAEGFRNIFTHGLMSFAAVCMIIVCLLIMGTFTLVAINVGAMLGDLEQQNEFFAYVDENCTEIQVKALQVKLEQVDNVASVLYVSREQAKEEWEARYEGTEDASLFQEVPTEVYRDRFAIHVVDIEDFSDTVRTVDAMREEGIAKVRAESEVASGFVVVRNVASGVAAVLAALLVVVLIFIISNTIKLGTFTRRDEIAIMKMCGATNSFVRWPFVFEGLILGLCGAVLGYFLQWGVYEVMTRAISSSDTIRLITVIPFENIAGRVLAIFCGTGLLVGVGGSVLSIRKFLQI